MCSAPNLQGACQDFTRSVSDLSGTRLQDAVSSLRPVRVGSGGGGTAIVVYTAPNFRGRSLVFSDDISDLRRVNLNDRIASVRVLGGRWVLCTDINYVGRRSVAADVPDLGAIGWAGRVSSIREGQNWWNAGGDPQGTAAATRAADARVAGRAVVTRAAATRAGDARGVGRAVATSSAAMRTWSPH